MLKFLKLFPQTRTLCNQIVFPYILVVLVVLVVKIVISYKKVVLVVIIIIQAELKTANSSQLDYLFMALSQGF
jgi:hypothetical protein